MRTGTPTYVEVDGRPTRVWVAGDPTASPVLLIHGIGRTLEDWSTQLPELARRHRVIALDLPGFGFSARRPEPATVASLAAGVAETLDALEEQRPVHVVGNSLGGAVALQLLADHPERVASLVLVNSAGFGTEVTPLLKVLALPVIGRLLTRRTTRLSARHLERTIYADRSLATRLRVDHALAAAERPGAGAFLREMVHALATFNGVREGWRRDLLRRTAEHPRPTLVVWGDRDRVLPARHLATAARHVPHARTHLFRDTGHMPQVERPVEFGGLVLDFLAETGS